ncbi:MAG TPA: hypothetical protein VF669_06945 [Tepidisphaeraceae bacterium]|jgi:hypothetical protein
MQAFRLVAIAVSYRQFTENRMRMLFVLLLFFACTLCFASDATTQTSTSDPVSLWTAGEKDKAVDTFVRADWTKGEVFPAGSVFRMTETEFKTKSGNEQKQLVKLMRLEETKLRDLVREVIARAKKSSAAGKPDEAKKMLDATAAAGRHFATAPDLLASLKAIGIALEKRAKEELAKLEE